MSNENLLDGYHTIGYGRERHFYRELTVTDTTYPVQCQVLILSTLTENSLIIHATAGAKLFYSFNGSSDSGFVSVGTVRELMKFDHIGHRKIWFRTATTATVNVEAW